MTSARLLAEWSHDPGCSCSKTSLGCCLLMAGTLWPVSFRDWPRSATSSRTGLYELPMLEPLTAVSGGSASPGLLKTPGAQLAVNGGSQPPDKRKQGGHGPTLADQVEHELLPTPRTADGMNSTMGANRERMTRNRSTGKRAWRGTIEEAVSLLPTPNATDGKGGNIPIGRMKEGRPRTIGDADLPAAIALLPTPTVADSRNSRNATAGRSPESTGHSGTTLSDVFWTGDLTDPPLSDGSES